MNEDVHGFAKPGVEFPVLNVIENGSIRRSPANAGTWRALKEDSGRNPGLRALDPDSIPQHHPVTNLDFDVTENCNLGCLYCFKGEMYTQSMSLDTMKSTLEWLLLASGDANQVNCNFMGGEPAMRFRQIREFVPWARRRGRSKGKHVAFSMTTNLTLFTEEIRAFVDQYGFGVLMSIDGCPEVQDASRPAKDGRKYSEVVERWAKSMLQTRPQSTARATLHPDYVDRFYDSMRYIHSIGFKTMAVSASEYQDWTEKHFSELEGQLEKMVDYISDVYVSGKSFNISSFKYYIKKLIRHRGEGVPENIQKQAQPCGAGKGYLMVDYTGDIWPCHRFDGADDAAGAEGQFRMGNIFGRGFREDLQSVFLNYSHFDSHKDVCGGCPINEICGGYCPAANLSDTKSLYTPHDTYCNWSWRMYAAAEKLYNGLRASSQSGFERMVKDSLTVDGSGEK